MLGSESMNGPLQDCSASCPDMKSLKSSSADDQEICGNLDQCRLRCMACLSSDEVGLLSCNTIMSSTILFKPGHFQPPFCMKWLWAMSDYIDICKLMLYFFVLSIDSIPCIIPTALIHLL